MIRDQINQSMRDADDHQFRLGVIRAAAIKANPEIRGKHIFEVGFNRCKWCDVEKVVRDRKVSNRIVDEKTGGSSQDIEVTEYNMEGGPCHKHMSRPIRVVDCLLAISNTAGDDAGPAEKGVEETVWKWNWKQDDLTLQSTECIKFIYELLK